MAIVIDQSKLSDKQQDRNADWIKKRNLRGKSMPVAPTKRGGKWIVVEATGRKSPGSGTFFTKKAAQKQADVINRKVRK